MTDVASHNPRCEKCIYYSQTTSTCDYILIVGRRRPCPAGNGCTVRAERKETKMKKAKWDTELGRLLWLEGKTDGEIADELHIQTSTVTSYRRRNWEKKFTRKEDAPPTEQMEAAAEKESTEKKEEHSVPETEVQRGKKPLEVYDVLEAATSEMKGIHAICTADAIMCLWNWESKEDLQKARSSIDYLLRRLEG